jgi:hypothetical protein
MNKDLKHKLQKRMKKHCQKKKPIKYLKLSEINNFLWKISAKTNLFQLKFNSSKLLVMEMLAQRQKFRFMLDNKIRIYYKSIKNCYQVT